MMRDCLTKNSRRWMQQIGNKLRTTFRGLNQYHDDIVSNVFYGVVKDINQIEEKYKELVNGGKYPYLTEEAWLYSCLRLRMKHNALNILNSSRVKRTFSSDESINYENTDGSNRVYARQSGVTWPEQEDVVFRKQILEHCSSLPYEERMLMQLAFDRATLEEIIVELGISKSEMIARRGSAMRHLLARTKDTIDGYDG